MSQFKRDYMSKINLIFLKYIKQKMVSKFLKDNTRQMNIATEFISTFILSNFSDNLKGS